MPIGSAAFDRLRSIFNRYTIRYLRPFLLATNCALFALLVTAPQTGYQIFPIFSLGIIDILINRFGADTQSSML
jgi:hypothetical protein